MYKHKFLRGRWLHSPFPKLHCFQDTHSCCTLPVEALANVISMGSCPILEQHLTWFTGSREVMQVLDLVHWSTTKKKVFCEAASLFWGGISTVASKRRIPSSLEWRLGHISCGDHLLSRSHPHDRTIIALGPAVKLQAGQASPWQSHLHRQTKQKSGS